MYLARQGPSILPQLEKAGLPDERVRPVLALLMRNGTPWERIAVYPRLARAGTPRLAAAEELAARLKKVRCYPDPAPSAMDLPLWSLPDPTAKSGRSG